MGVGPTLRPPYKYRKLGEMVKQRKQQVACEYNRPSKESMDINSEMNS